MIWSDSLVASGDLVRVNVLSGIDERVGVPERGKVPSPVPGHWREPAQGSAGKGDGLVPDGPRRTPDPGVGAGGLLFREIPSFPRVDPSH
ncbi:hypothetical protein STRTUCAR8_10122, partial [Streptomyces turgidiscabies Car8]